MWHRLGGARDVVEDDSGHEQPHESKGVCHAVIGTGVDEPAGEALGSGAAVMSTPGDDHPILGL